MKKYKILMDRENTITDVYGSVLHRIQALKNFGIVKAGSIGGYIEKESNLSQHGLAWVFDDAKVYGNARVFGDAWISDYARVYDDAQVYGDAYVYERANVYGDAQICGYAYISGEAKVYDRALVYGRTHVSGHAEVAGDSMVSVLRHCMTLGPIGILCDYLTICPDKNGQAFIFGDVLMGGNLDNFEQKVREYARKDVSESWKSFREQEEAEYMAFIQLARIREKEWLNARRRT